MKLGTMTNALIAVGMLCGATLCFAQATEKITFDEHSEFAGYSRIVDNLSLGSTFEYSERNERYEISHMSCVTGKLVAKVVPVTQRHELLGAPTSFSIATNGPQGNLAGLRTTFSETASHQIEIRLVDLKRNPELSAQFYADHCQGRRMITGITLATRAAVDLYVPIRHAEREAILAKVKGDSRFTGLTLKQSSQDINALFNEVALKEDQLMAFHNFPQPFVLTHRLGHLTAALNFDGNTLASQKEIESSEFKAALAEFHNVSSQARMKITADAINTLQSLEYYDAADVVRLLLVEGMEISEAQDIP